MFLLPTQIDKYLTIFKAIFVALFKLIIQSSESKWPE